jgi:outer membrane protein with beta-barrel domain
MRSAQYVLAAVLTFALAGTATAQTTPSGATTQPTYVGETVSHWLASGFVGGSFDTSGDSARVEDNGSGVTFGAQVGYLWRGIVGPEFLAEWAPNFDVASTLIDGDTHVFSYMANAIGAIPLGADGQVQPYVSGGFGRVQVAADIFNADGTSHNNQNSRWGTNIGGGIMAFAGTRYGVRGDVRYYHTSSLDDGELNGTTADQFVESLVSGLSFWRASGGVSVRW